MPDASPSRPVVIVSIVSSVAIAAVKFATALLFGSAAMLGEAIHSTVDTVNEGLLLFGSVRAERPADEEHPFGYGKELYFWAFVIALIIFTLGGGLSVYEGVAKILAPAPVSQVVLNFAVLGIAAVFEAVSFVFAWQRFRLRRRIGLFPALQHSKDPGLFVVIIEEGGALIGIALAGLALGLAVVTGRSWFDGAGSVAVGLLLVLLALFLARETRSLLVGESASPIILDRVRKVLAEDSRVQSVDEMLTMHLGPRDILLALTIDFSESLSGEAVEQAARELSLRIQEEVPQITRVFLRPQYSDAQTKADGDNSGPRHGKHGLGDRGEIDQAGRKQSRVAGGATTARGASGPH